MTVRIDISKDEIAEFCKANRIRRLSVFGSAVRDDFSPESGVDLLVEFEPGARIGLRFFRMQEELSRMLGRKADLNTPGFLSRHFRNKALAEAEAVYDAA